MRNYVQPKIPYNWRSAERTFGIMLMDVLDELHMPIKEEWLSSELKQKLESVSKSSSTANDYSESAVDTGIKWTDGSSVMKITKIFDVSAGVATDSESIDGLGIIIRSEGCVYTSSGACYPIGCDNGSQSVSVWKNSNSDKLRVLSSVSGTAYVTVYYIDGEAPDEDETYVFFNDGYTKDANGDTILWGANQLTRPNNASQGYTTLGYAELDTVGTNGYMHLYIAAGANYYYNSHVCTSEIIHIPSNASKLYVRAYRGANALQMNVALLPNNAANSMDTGNGGVISTNYTLTTALTDYAVQLGSAMQGSDDYRIVINIRGKGDSYRSAHVTKVWFE